MNIEETNIAAGTAGVVIIQEMRKHKGTIEDGLNITACLLTNLLANFARNADEAGGPVGKPTGERITEDQGKVMMMLHMQLAEKIAECVVQVLGENPLMSIDVESGDIINFNEGE